MGKRKTSISPSNSNSMLVPLQSLPMTQDDCSDRRQLAIVSPFTTTTTTTATTSRFSRFELPIGWGVEEVPRSDPSRIDRYYYEPGTGNKFRSLKAVERYINGETCASQLRPMVLRSHFQHPSYSKMIIYGGKLMELDEEEFNQGQQAIVASASTSMSTMNTIPDGWVVEQVPRRIGDQKDKYYYEPGTGRKFRSQASVMRHLAELEEDMKEDIPLSAAREETKENRPLSKAFKFSKHRKNSVFWKKKLASNNKQSSSFVDPPKKIKWVLASPRGDAWNPFICERPVPDSVKVQWDQRFKSAMENDGHGQPCSGASKNLVHLGRISSTSLVQDVCCI